MPTTKSISAVHPVMATMVITKPIGFECVATFKAVRLSALHDTPSAFGSTFADESRLSEADWDRRVAQWNGDRSICRLAWDGDRACGIAAGYLDPEQATHAHLVSMWVAPAHRRHGVGRLLVEEIIDWACGRRAQTLRLMVTSNNGGAIRFYQRLGFRKTGKIEHYPNDPALVEFEMIRPIARDGRMQV
jgi:ribosomal protein S18 acetylase RimI-like enzyme